jgi:hypothetical protein
MNDENHVPTEQLLFGLFAGPQGMRIQSPMPPRQLLDLLLTVTEQVREAAYAQAAAPSPIAVVGAVPGLRRG